MTDNEDAMELAVAMQAVAQMEDEFHEIAARIRQTCAGIIGDVERLAGAMQAVIRAEAQTCPASCAVSALQILRALIPDSDDLERVDLASRQPRTQVFKNRLPGLFRGDDVVLGIAHTHGSIGDFPIGGAKTDAVSA